MDRTLRGEAPLRRPRAGLDSTRGFAVVRVDPADGATGVLSDTVLLLRLSHAIEPESLAVAFLEVRGGSAVVPGRAVLGVDPCVLFWTAERRLAAGEVHFVRLSGLRDRMGREMLTHLSRFTPCALARDDLSA